METLVRAAVDGGIAHVTLERPGVRNAFNAALIAEVRRIFTELSADSRVRAIVLAGAGKVFCGGADINWMRDSLDLSQEENRRDAEAMADMFRTVDACEKAVIVRVHGAALAGGTGLCAAADVVVAADDAIFGFTETKLGLIPATISPFVMAKIGVSHARALFLTGERFGAQRALAIGLVHEVVPEAGLDAAVQRIVDELKGAAPGAIAAAKRMIRDVRATTYDGARELTAHAIAAQRTSSEGQEGLRAFLERRKPRWAEG